MKIEFDAFAKFSFGSSWAKHQTKMAKTIELRADGEVGLHPPKISVGIKRIEKETLRKCSGFKPFDCFWIKL